MLVIIATELSRVCSLLRGLAARGDSGPARPVRGLWRGVWGVFRKTRPSGGGAEWEFLLVTCTRGKVLLGQGDRMHRTQRLASGAVRGSALSLPCLDFSPGHTRRALLEQPGRTAGARGGTVLTASCLFAGEGPKAHIRKLAECIRWSYGAGIVLRLGNIARLELNYCVPMGVQKGDR